MAKKKEMTPLMKQYWSVKNLHPDKILLFRMGDFFEMFHEDAQIAAPILGIALTARNKKSGDQTPMCGVPHHSIGGQINKLLAAGKKVAICDQVEDPKQAKGLVRREVTRVLSPGMVYDPETIEAYASHFIGAFDDTQMAFMDSTTGECFFYEVSSDEKRKELLMGLYPIEMVLSEAQTQEFVSFAEPHWNGTASEQNDLADGELGEACRRLLAYAVSMQGESLLKSLAPFQKREWDTRLELSHKVLTHLEVFKTYQGEKEGSLVHAIDRTRTPGGGRRLRYWMNFPLTQKEKIEERLDQVEHWQKNTDSLKQVRSQLSQMGDLERRLGKMSQPHCHPRDLKSLGESLRAAHQLIPLFSKLDGLQNKVAQFVSEVDKALVEELPANFRDGGFIAKGYNSQLDEYIDWATEAQSKVRELEARERELTGITSLKVRYNNVFGFYIEVTNTHKSKVPTDRYQRKQTLTNAERYVTDELNEIEKKVITAKTKRVELENQIFRDLQSEALTQMDVFLDVASSCNELDVITSLAWLAFEQDYVRPQFLDEGFELKGSRHPVIEQVLDKPFSANDISLFPRQSILLTGPNMAGKSTIMRQVAISSLLAQMGSFVPARQAKLPVLDKIFTRIGASDFLTEGLSTFMVEMQEAAMMLKGATEKSLVILDEVGRGTSTYDGMSLAQAILEHFIEKVGAYTLFATHYHELTELAEQFPGRLVNRHMTIQEKSGQIRFLYQLAEGPAQKSYGIQVAKIAGLPTDVVKRASNLLRGLESGAQKGPSPQLDLWAQSQSLNESVQEMDESIEALLSNIRKTEVQNLTPLDALNKLAEWQKELS